MSPSSEDLIYFWRSCVRRRREQLASLQETMNWITDDIGRDEVEVGSDRHWKLMGIMSEQRKWLNDAQSKLEHAEKMLNYLDMDKL
jgi:hypothetical protein